MQFHPESAASEYGYAMLDRFLRGDRARPRSCRPVPTARRGDAAAASSDEPAEPFVPPPVEQVR